MRIVESTTTSLSGNAQAAMRWNRKDLVGLRELSVDEINFILETADAFKQVGIREIKKVPALRGKTLVNFFVEPSTRTRTSFELAAFRLSADVINISATASSLTKGETLKDTARNLEALHADILVLRHSSAGAPQFLANRLEASVINAGDGAHEHPTQALLDLYTIREKRGKIAGLHVAIIGDILFSRVARSNIFGLVKLGACVTLVGPSTLVPREFEKLGVQISHKCRRRESPPRPARTSAQGIFPRNRRIHPVFRPNERARKTFETGLSDYAPRPDQPRRRDRQRSGRWIAERHSRPSYQRPRRPHGCSLSLRRDCEHMSTTIIRNGHVIDPANKRDEVGDVYIEDGKIVASRSEFRNPNSEIEEIDASGLIVTPGLIDMHVHLREPGFGHKETIESGSRAAAAGGFTTIVCMPNTSPVADDPSTIAWIKSRAATAACVNVLPAGAISKDLAGEELAPIGSLVQAGIVAITDDGHCIQNHELMRRAVEYARMVDVPVLDHCQDYNFVGNGVVNEGYWSTLLGLPGWPAVGEEAMVMRNILLAELCNHHIHCQHVTTAKSVRLLREARRRGVKISGEVCPHHIALTDEAIQNFDTNYKMNPPLRAQTDVDALLEGISDGTLSVLASDHAPHADFEKEVEFDAAPFGIIGLETALGLFLDLLVHKHRKIDIVRLIKMCTVEPAKLLKLEAGTLSVGASADVTLLNPDLEWTVQIDKFESGSRNSPFDGWKLKGRAVRTIVGGKTVWELD